MSWVAVDSNGTEAVYTNKPERFSYDQDLGAWYDFNGKDVRLPSGSIEKLIGRILTWEDEPVELKELINYEQPDIDTIIKTVCNHFQIDPALILFKTRRREISETRQLVFALVRFGLRLSSIKTGTDLGMFDHANVLHGIKKVSDRYQCYKDYRHTVDGLIRSLWSDPDQQQYITDRIIDPHKDRIESQAKFARVASLRGTG